MSPRVYLSYIDRSIVSQSACSIWMIWDYGGRSIVYRLFKYICSFSIWERCVWENLIQTQYVCIALIDIEMGIKMISTAEKLYLLVVPLSLFRYAFFTAFLICLCRRLCPLLSLSDFIVPTITDSLTQEVFQSVLFPKSGSVFDSE